MSSHAYWSIAGAGSAALLLAGCPIPIPPGYDRDSRENVAATAPEAIKAGETTREDVLMLLGEPDVVAIDESWIAYASTYTSGGLAVLVAAGSGAGVVGTANMRYRRLIIEFDPLGATTALVFESKRCFEYGAVGLNNNLNSQAVGNKPCLDAQGRDIPSKLHLPAMRE